MTCPNCRGETHRFAGRLVCSAGCGWSQAAVTWRWPAACTCGPRASHAVRCERCGLPPGVPAPAAPRVEPRRPQVGDSVEHSLLGRPEPIEVTAIDLHAFRAVGTDGSRWTIPYKSPHWRWPATQGTAVAGPACVCPFPRTSCPACSYRTDERYLCEACATASPTADVELGNVRDELAETQEALANMTEERDMQQFHARDVATERDALAAQLNVAREALTLIRDGFDCRATPGHQSHSRHCYVCMAAVALAPPGARCHCTHEAGDSPCPIHDARSEDAMARARAALAASRGTP